MAAERLPNAASQAPHLDRSLAYRADIDGLRAIAVLAIILFHIDDEWMPGGFLGVDLFFVISGFLITGIIYPEIAAQRFSFTEFYWRRVKRILPALFVVVAVTVMAGLVLMVPDDFRRLASSAVYSLLSLANVYFYFAVDTGYFADDSAEFPLLHLWSLGVEEQFYLLWPLVLVVMVSRLGRRTLLVAVGVAALASFLLGELLLPIDPSFAYYMLPARAGELLAGALAAMLLRSSARSAPFGAAALQWAAAAGAALIAWSIAALEPDNGFPGLSSVPVTLGAVLLLVSGAFGSTQVGRFLSVRPLVAIGLISYSAYLWHWPLLAFVRYFYGRVSVPQGLVALALTLLLAALTYRFIERPFRASKLPPWKGIIRYGAMPAAAGVAACCFLIGGQKLGILDRPEDAPLKNLYNSGNRVSFICQTSKFAPPALSDKQCVIGPGEKPTVLIWGDSNAAHYVGMLRVFAEHEGFTFRNLSHPACSPMFGDPAAYIRRKENAPSCRKYLEAMRREISGYQAVVLGGSWTTYDRNRSYRGKIAETIAALAATGKTIVILGKIPVFPGFNRKCDARRVRFPLIDCEARSSGILVRDQSINRYLRALAARYPNVTYFDVRGQICDGDVCSAYKDDRALYFDSGHLSNNGSRALGELIRAKGEIPDVFRRLGQRRAAAMKP